MNLPARPIRAFVNDNQTPKNSGYAKNSVSKLTAGPGGPTLIYAVTSKTLDEEALSWFVDDIVARTVVAAPAAAPGRSRSRWTRCGLRRSASPPPMSRVR